MKRIILALALTLLASSCSANENGMWVFRSGDVMVRPYAEEDCLEVKTRNNRFKIFGCGQVLRQEWSVLNENEDDITAPMWTISDGPALDAQLHYSSGENQ